MKVAVCLSGFPRTMRYSYPYLKKYILDQLNPDIFFFGYSDHEHLISSQDIIDTYKPKLYKIRTYTEEIEDEFIEIYGGLDFRNPELPAATPIQILSQYYNMYQSNELRKEYEYKNNFKYDMVMRLRTDYYFWRPLSEDELDIKDNEIYIPDTWNFGGVSCGYAFGKGDVMDKYSSLFIHMRKYNLQENFPFHPEKMLWYNLIRHGIKIKHIQNQFWWELSDFKLNNCESSYIYPIITNPSRRSFK